MTPALSIQKLVRLSGLTLSLSGFVAIVAVVEYSARAFVVGEGNIVMSVPCLILSWFLWTEKLRSWLIYLFCLSLCFALLGPLIAIKQMVVSRTTLTTLPHLACVELLFLTPIFLRKLWAVRRKAREVKQVSVLNGS